jgi:hypothetical protein
MYLNATGCWNIIFKETHEMYSIWDAFKACTYLWKWKLAPSEGKINIWPETWKIDIKKNYFPFKKNGVFRSRHNHEFYQLYCNRFDQRIARQGLRKHGPTRDNKTTEICNPFLGNGSINTLPRRCNDVTTTVHSYRVTCVFCVVRAAAV